MTEYQCDHQTGMDERNEKMVIVFFDDMKSSKRDLTNSELSDFSSTNNLNRKIDRLNSATMYSAQL